VSGTAGASGEGRPRRHRRVVRPGADDPVLPRSPDDSDVGWGERPDPDDDERWRREVPPHWGRD